MKSNLIENYVSYLLVVAFLYWLFVFGWVQCKRAKSVELEKRLEYATGFQDGINACKAKLAGMNTESIMERYYKGYDPEKSP